MPAIDHMFPSILKSIWLIIFLVHSQTWAVSSQSDDDHPTSVTVDSRPSDSARSLLIPTAKSVRMFETRVVKNGNDLASRLMLGRLYLRQARENDAFHDFLKAEEQFRSVLKREPVSLTASAYLAEALMAQHRFREAQTIAKEVLDSKPDAAISLATLGDSHVQLGEYDEANQVYERLLGLSRAPEILVRMARLREIQGKSDAAKKLMAEALSLQVAAAAVAETEAWYFWRQGQLLFNVGEVDDAKAKLTAALEINPDYSEALALLAQIESFEGNREDAVRMYEKAIALSEKPPTLVALGDLLVSIGRGDEATRYFNRAETLMDEESQDPQAGPPHARERAIYFSNHDKRLEHALQLAVDDFKTRQDIYAHDVLAWCLYKNQKYEEARVHSRQALAENTLDATLFYHAGMIEIACGERAKGHKLLQTALDTNPCFSIIGVAQIRDALTANSDAN